MNTIVKREGFYLGLLFSTNKTQAKCLLRSVTSRQLMALLEVIYNICRGYFELSENTASLLNRYLVKLRRLLKKQLSRQQRIRFMIKHYHLLSRLFKDIKKRYRDAMAKELILIAKTRYDQMVEKLNQMNINLSDKNTTYKDSTPDIQSSKENAESAIAGENHLANIDHEAHNVTPVKMDYAADKIDKRQLKKNPQ